MFNKLSPLLFTGIFSVGSVFAETLRFAEYERDGVGKPAEYNFENSSSGDFEITGVPIDADWNRAGYARAKERAYFLIGVQGTVDEFYVCLGSDSGVKYQKDYGKAKLVGIPSNLDTSNFSIGFDHNNGRLFYAGLTKSRDGLFLAEFSDPEFSKGKGKFENGSAVPIKNVPDDVEWDRWAFSWGSSLSLHAAGEGTRLYVVRMNAGRFSFDFEDTTVEQVAVRNVPENSDSQWIEIGTDGDDRSHRYLVQALRADDIFSDAVPIGDGFWMSSWFGTFFGDDFPWVIRSEEEGFLYPYGSPESLTYFEQKSGHFLWTSEEVSPWAYNFSLGRWRPLIPAEEIVDGAQQQSDGVTYVSSWFGTFDGEFSPFLTRSSVPTHDGGTESVDEGQIYVQAAGNGGVNYFVEATGKWFYTSEAIAPSYFDLETDEFLNPPTAGEPELEEGQELRDNGDIVEKDPATQTPLLDAAGMAVLDGNGQPVLDPNSGEFVVVSTQAQRDAEAAAAAEAAARGR